MISFSQARVDEPSDHHLGILTEQPCLRNPRQKPADFLSKETGLGPVTSSYPQYMKQIPKELEENVNNSIITTGPQQLPLSKG